MKKSVTINLQSSLAKRDEDKVDLGNATTLMLRNIPNRYTRAMLLKEFEDAGTMKSIDFFYLPMDIRHNCNVGYCFVNLTSKKAAQRFAKTFGDKKLEQVTSEKRCRISPAKVQGKEENIQQYMEQYRSSAVVSIDYQPMVFENGKQCPFPMAVVPTGNEIPTKEASDTEKDDTAALDEEAPEIEIAVNQEPQIFSTVVQASRRQRRTRRTKSEEVNHTDANHVDAATSP